MHENPIWPKGHIESICPLGNSIDAWTSCTAQGTYRYACKSRYGVKVLNCHWNCNCIFSMHIVHFHCTLHIFIAHCTFSLHIAHFHCTLYIFTAHCTHSLLILYCCSSSCGTLTAEPLLSNSRVASVKQVVIAIIKEFSKISNFGDFELFTSTIDNLASRRDREGSKKTKFIRI